MNKVPVEGGTELDAVFAKLVAYRTGSDPIEIGDLGSKVKVTVTQNPFFFIILC